VLSWLPFSFNSSSDPYRLAIIYKRGLGDKFSAIKMYQGALNLGWDCIVIGDVAHGRSLIEKNILYKQMHYVLKKSKPHLVLCLNDAYLPEKHPHYLMVSEPDLLEKKLNWSKYPHLKSYDGYVLAYNNQQIKVIKDALKKMNISTPSMQGFHVTPVGSSRRGLRAPSPHTTRHTVPYQGG
jgi:hypothetical protein